jgi:hypothetical protein
MALAAGFKKELSWQESAETSDDSSFSNQNWTIEKVARKDGAFPDKKGSKLLICKLGEFFKRGHRLQRKVRKRPAPWSQCERKRLQLKEKSCDYIAAPLDIGAVPSVGEVAG